GRWWRSASPRVSLRRALPMREEGEMATREETPKAPPGGLVCAATAHPWSYTASVLLVAVAYYTAAKLGLRLALVGRNITPFWPPTGIAVVAFLVFGRSVWPGV